MFGGFTEGLQLFASFAMLMNFPRFNKMKGMGQIVSWSVRDESCTAKASSSCSTPSAQERGCLDQGVRRRHLPTLPEDRASWRTPSSTSPSKWAREGHDAKEIKPTSASSPTGA
jgi:hypothetical protein